MSYTRPAITYPGSPAVSYDVLVGLLACSQLRSSSLVTRCDDTGQVELEDLTPFLVRDSETSATSQVTRDCTVECQGRLSLQLSKPLAWGSDRMMYTHLLSSPEYNDGQWYGWQLGVYIPTTPGFDSLDRGDVWAVTGYDRIYLLQQNPLTSLAFAGGTTYVEVVREVLVAAGLLPSAGALADVCDYPGDWSAKTLDQPANYPLGSSNTYVSIINEQLKASGARPLFCDQQGRFQVADATPLASRPVGWAWAGDANPYAPPHFPQTKVTVAPHRTSYQGDVWNTINRWVAVQSGLTFEPVIGSGMAQVDNTTVPPTDQVTTGTVRTATMSLPASGQADLETQLNTIVTDALTGYEGLGLTTNPWPMAWQEDVFSYSHPNLPDIAVRRLVCRSWTLPLSGDPMSFQCNAVASL